MLCRYAVLAITVAIVRGNVLSQPFQPFSRNEIQKNGQKASQLVAMDNVPAADEHHKIIILVPQIVRQEKKKPKSHHPVYPSHKVIPVVHSGKVIHAHHHHGKVDHMHKHDGKGKHDHKHTGTGAHKHSHFGVGTHTHKHQGKAAHDHKHEGKASHKHGHTGKGTIHHHHAKHHHHHHPELPAPPKAPKKYVAPFGFEENAYGNYENAPRVKIDSEILKALNPVAFSGAAIASGTPGRFIQIRIPDENEANAVKEIDIDTESDVAVLKKNYLTPEELNGLFSGHQDDGGEAGEDNDDADVEDEEAYQLGDGYKLAASAAAKAAVEADDGIVSYSERDAARSAVPQHAGRNNVIAYSDTYHYQY